VISAIGTVTGTLDLFGRDRNVLSVFSALCVDVAFAVFDLGRITVRIIAADAGFAPQGLSGSLKST